MYLSIRFRKMSENVQDDDQKNVPTDNGESEGGDSPIQIEEAESTQPSPESGQGSPHSPDSTMAEGGAEAHSSTDKKLPPGSLAKQNPMLVNVLTGNYATTSSNSAEASSSSRQEVPDSPSRRKREGDAPAPEPPFSPTKKLKSPKKDKSPNKEDKK